MCEGVSSFASSKPVWRVVNKEKVSFWWNRPSKRRTETVFIWQHISSLPSSLIFLSANYSPHQQPGFKRFYDPLPPSQPRCPSRREKTEHVTGEVAESENTLNWGGPAPNELPLKAADWVLKNVLA